MDSCHTATICILNRFPFSEMIVFFVFNHIEMLLFGMKQHVLKSIVFPKARVTNKSDIRRWSNSRGEGHLFSMDLVDESGEIRATAFKDQCDKYYNMIEIGKVYYITQGTLKAANKQYSTLNNDYEMTFRDSTEVIPCVDEDEASKIPTLSFDFCQISQLNAGLKDSTVDIIGVVKSATDCNTIVSSRTQKELKKRDIVLVDKSLTEVGLTLWGTTAENFDGSSNPVVAIKGKFRGETILD